MENLLALSFDYRLLLFALPFFMLARQAGKLRLHPDASAPWSLLVWVGLGYGLAECLTLSAMEAAGPTALRLVRAAIITLSLIALLEFGRRQVRIAGRLLPGAWIYPPLMLLALTGVFHRLAGLAATSRLAFGIPGSLMSGLALWRLSKSIEGQKRLGLQAAAVSLWLAAPAILLSAPNAFLIYSTGSRAVEFLASAQYLSQAAMAFCALGAWTGLGIYRRNLGSAVGSGSMLPTGSLWTAIAMSVAISFAAMDRERWLFETGSQNNPTEAEMAALVPQEASQPLSQADRTWEQIMCDRRQLGLNFLKGAARLLSA